MNAYSYTGLDGHSSFAQLLVIRVVDSIHTVWPIKIHGAYVSAPADQILMIWEAFTLTYITIPNSPIPNSP